MRKPNLNRIMEDNSDKTGHIPMPGNLRLPQQHPQQYSPYLNMFGQRGDSQYAPTFIGANAGVPVSDNSGITFGYNTLRSPYMDPRNGYNVGYEYTGPKGNQTSFNVGRSGQGQTTIGARIGFKNGGSWLSKYARGGISGSTYEIQSGDTLSDIAERSGVSMDELAALNNIDDVNRIYANQTLNLGTNANRPAMTSNVPKTTPAPIPAKVNKPTFSPVNPSVQNIISVRNNQRAAKPVVKPAQASMIQPAPQPTANPSTWKGRNVKGQMLANFRDQRNLESGTVVDKGTNTLYVIKNGKVFKSAPVLTGQAGKNKNTDINTNNNSLDYLENHPEARSTPTGTYFMSPRTDIYGWPGYNLKAIPAYGQAAPNSVNTAMHITYGANAKPGSGLKGHPDAAEFSRRNAGYNMPGNQRYLSYGCTNMQGETVNCLNNQFPQGDTAIYVDSRVNKDKDFLQNSFNIKPHKMGGEPCYECGGMYAEGGEQGGPGWGDAAWTAAQIADPTGVLSYGDAYRGWKVMVQNPSWGNFGSALLNTAAALPVVGQEVRAVKAAGKIGKAAKEWKELNALQKAGRVANRAIVNPVRTLDNSVGIGAGVGATTAKLLQNAPKVVKNYVAPMTTIMNRGARWEKLMTPVGQGAVNGIANVLNYAQGPYAPQQKYGGQTNWLNNYK